MKQRIEELLKKSGVEYKLIPLPDDLPLDIQSHANFHKIGLANAMATIVYRTEKGLIAAIKRADTQIDEEKLKKLAGVKKLSYASKQEVESIGTEPGIVPYLGLDIPYYLDSKVLEIDKAYGTGGAKNLGMVMASRDMVKVNHAVVGDFVSGTEGRRILSGMRASGRLHIGNYLGGAKGMIALQNDPKCETFYMVADLHGITTPYDKSSLAEATKNVIIDYLAAGLDPKKSVIFVQSQVPQHMELAYYFSTVMTVGKMLHLPTYKEKIKQHPEHVMMALLNYPVLMAADILLYKASLVPVGVDQEPHIEVAREVARRMNADYGTDFPEPQRFATKGDYVPSLTGEGKMSKSVEGSYIGLTDDLPTIKAKVAKAPTDERVVNLFKFMELFLPGRLEHYNAAQERGDIRYSEMKSELAEAIYEELRPIQERRKDLEGRPKYVEEVIRSGAVRARKVAAMTIGEVKEKMGLLI